MSVTKHRYGFTLIEVLIAVCIASIILGVVTAGLVSGIKIWHRVLQLQVKKSPPEVLEMLLRNDLNATADKNIFNSFKGTSTELRFCRFVNIDDMIQIATVEYIYDSSNNQLSYTKTVFPRSEDSEVQVLNTKELYVENLTFSYLIYNRSTKEFEWLEPEITATNMPRIIKFSFSDNLENEDEPILRSIDIR
ncbi:MAG: prepilin-type N-terminal cleavage/methylation domain-containing protein [Kiritimatiellae bacterium]|jgi:prepilin-type N-terminal cleavage/methylation domain-containing protein|nr:prepilin-type N-terminal cleavage/methylation domain-containing protein [Kiritimatiellia bacterium]